MKKMEAYQTKTQDEPTYNASLQTKEKKIEKKESIFREHLEEFLKTMHGNNIYLMLR